MTETQEETTTTRSSPQFQLVYGIHDDDGSVGSVEQDMLPNDIINDEVVCLSGAMIIHPQITESMMTLSNEETDSTTKEPARSSPDTLPISQSVTAPVDQSVTSSIDQSVTPPVDQSVTAPVDQSVTPPVDQSVTPPVDQSDTAPVDQSVTPPVDQSDTTPVDQSVTLPIDQSDTAPIDQSDTPPIDQSFTPPVDQSVTPSIHQSVTPPVDQSDTAPINQSDDPPFSPSISLSPNVLKTQSQEGVFFNGIRYLGSSTVDAPVSETEANRKMSVLKNQAGQPIPIILQIPPNNDGNIMLKDPSTNQILTAFSIRHVLFCARGDIDSNLNDCLALNVIHKRSGVYHCHVFLCEIPEAVSIYYILLCV